jgi:glycosyltransferase involved in cell wall biosynthesis
MNTKKINLIFDKFYPDMGGVQIYMKEAYSEMVNLGWDVSIHCINTNLNKFNHLPEKEIICGMKVNRYKFFKYKFLPFSLNFSFFEESVISLQEFCIFPHYLIYIITLFLKITGLKKYKLVLNSHGLFGNDISRYPGISRKIKWYIDHTIGVLLVNLTVDQIYVISNPEKNSLISAGIKSSIMHDIYYGLDKDAHKNIENESSSLVKDQVSKITPYLLQVGRIDRYK